MPHSLVDICLYVFRRMSRLHVHGDLQVPREGMRSSSPSFRKIPGGCHIVGEYILLDGAGSRLRPPRHFSLHVLMHYSPPPNRVPWCPNDSTTVSSRLRNDSQKDTTKGLELHQCLQHIACSLVVLPMLPLAFLRAVAFAAAPRASLSWALTSAVGTPTRTVEGV